MIASEGQQRAMSVSAWAIKNPVPALMLFVLLTIAGIVSFSSMKVQNYPDLELPTINVVALLPGAAPTQLETEVARKIENSIAALPSLKHIHTKIQDGTVSVSAEFRIEKPAQEALDEVRSALQRVRSELPADMRDPAVSKLDLAGLPILAFTIAAPHMDEEALSWFVDQTVTKTLISVRGVGAVTRVGGVNREVQVNLDPLRLLALNATAAEISRGLKSVQIEASGGRADVASQEHLLRAIGTVESVDALGNLPINLADGRKVKLNRVATINEGIQERRSAALLNGKRVVGFEVTRSRGASEVEVGAEVNKALAGLQAAHPGIQIETAFDFVKPVNEEYQGSLKLLYEGAILAVLVVWFFLRDWRATFISAIALPLSVIPAFIGMHYLGFSINVVTLLALSLVVGVLVDDAIVEVENIMRHLRMGKSPYQAAMEAADEIGLAVIATTFTLVAVFLPTAFMSGVAGKFFKQFGWTASLAVFASLVVARALTPMMAAYMLRPLVAKQEADGWLMTRYMRWVAWCLKRRFWTILAAGAFFVGSVMLIPLLPQGFIPPDDVSQTQVNVELPPGSTLLQTLSVAEQARLLIVNIPSVKSIYTTVGAGAAGGDPFAPASIAQARKATLTITLAARSERAITKQVIEDQLRAAISQLAGVRTSVGLGASGEKYILVLTSDDREALSRAVVDVGRDLRTIHGIGSITSSASLVRPEILIRPDFSKAADLGVSTAAMAETLRIATTGDYDVDMPKLNLAQRQVPVMVKLDNAAREDLGWLSRIAVPSMKQSSPAVMLGQVASLEMASSPAEISRYDRTRNVNFEIELSNMELGDVKKAVQKLDSIKQLPANVRQVEVGDAEVQDELFASFSWAMLIGVLCIYIVLVLLFKDFMQPGTILAALPLSLGGAFIALLLANKSFSMPSLIGLVMLMGIATKNSILLVEYAILARKTHGMTRLNALLDACHKRARPIVMTSLAMAAGMLPVALGWGNADPSFRSPMATAVIGGLVTSTFLSLLVIPVVFTYVDDAVIGFSKWILRKPPK